MAGLAKPYTAKKPPLFNKNANVVIVGGGPSGLHFASKMLKAGYKAPVVLEATDRPGGKSHTKVYDDYGNIPHEMGTCYLSKGYAGVRKILAEYGLGDQEIKFGGLFEEGEDEGGPPRIGRMVWDLENKNDLRRDRYGGLGQNIEDWFLISEGDEGDAASIEAAFESELAAAQAEGNDLREAVHTLKESEKDDDEEVEKSFISSLLNGFRKGKERAIVDKDKDGQEDLSLLKKMLGALRVSVASGKYIRLHRELFGEYAYGLPPRPSPENQKRLDCTLGDFLQQNGLGALQRFFTYSQSAQGYGAVPWVPALYGLWWNSPTFMELSFSPIGRLTSKVPDLTILKCGFSALWSNMIAQDKIDVRLNCPVSEVRRSSDGVSIKYKEGGKDKTIDADYVVVAVPYKLALQRGVLADIQPQEKAIIDRINGLTLKTTLVSIPEPSLDYTFPGQVWLAPLNDFNGHLRYVRNSSLTLHGREIERRPRVVTYQALREPPTPELNDKLRETLLNDLKIAEYGDVEVLYEKPWDYFWHFDQQALNEGKPWELLNMQGQNRTVWAGASACFESVLDVAAYNDLLFEMHQMD